MKYVPKQFIKKNAVANWFLNDFKSVQNRLAGELLQYDTLPIISMKQRDFTAERRQLGSSVCIRRFESFEDESIDNLTSGGVDNCVDAVPTFVAESMPRGNSCRLFPTFM